MIASVMIELLAVAAMASAPQTRDCRSISDQASRLACYDAREAAAPAAPALQAPPRVAAPLPPPAPAAPAVAAAAPPAAVTSYPSRPSAAAIVRASPSGKVASVVPLRYGLFRLVLEDGRAFDTATNIAAPPAVGTSVTLRRTLIGTTFLDIPGRSPMAVRLARQ